MPGRGLWGGSGGAGRTLGTCPRCETACVRVQGQGAPIALLASQSFSWSLQTDQRTAVPTLRMRKSRCIEGALHRGPSASALPPFWMDSVC